MVQNHPQKRIWILMPKIFLRKNKVEDFESVEMISQPRGYVEYSDFMRENSLVFMNSPVAGEAYITTGWNDYHNWEDGRYSFMA